MLLRKCFIGPALCVWLAGAGALPARADALGELAKYSVFPQVDMGSLAGGKVVAARGPAMGSDRDLSVQSVYVMRMPVGRALELHKSWDSSRHAELKVYLHRDFGGQPAPKDFTGAPIPGNGAVRKLAAATEKLPQGGDLQLSKGEAARFKGGGGGGVWPGPVASFWGDVLYGRAVAFAQRGLAGEPPYDTAGGPVRVSEEIGRLLREQPKVREVFTPLIERSPLGGEAGSGASPYWELIDVEGEAAFTLGGSASVQGADGAQYAEIQYYASGGDYAYVTLYQMWPVTVDGKPATLVWRVDCLSSAELSDLGPFDRMGSGSAVMQDVRRIVKLFLADTNR